MQNDKLLPCPFCGGELKLNTILSIFICNKCKVHIGFPTCYTDKNRIKAVNTRKPMERIVERLEECKFVTSMGNDIISRNKFIAYNGALNIVRKEGGLGYAE